MKKTQTEKFAKSYYLLVFANAFTAISFYTVNPILTKYLTGMGMAITLASTIAGLFSLTALCVRPFTGILADKLSPRRILFGSITLLAISVTGYALVTNATLIIFFRILNGVAFCFNGTILTTYASMFVPENRMGEGIGYLGLGQVAASAIGPMIGAGIGDACGYKYAFFVGGAISLVGLVLVFLVKDEEMLTKPAEQTGDGPKGIHLSDIIVFKLVPIAMLSALFSCSNGIVSNFLALHTDAQGFSGYSNYFTLLAVCMFALRPFAGKFNDRFGLAKLLIPAYLLTAIGTVIIANASSLAMVLLAAPLMAFGQAGGQPAIQAYCIKEAGARRRGVATSTYYIFADFFQGMGPIVGGIISEKTNSYATPFYGSSLLLVLGLVLFLLLALYKKKNNTYDFG